MLRCQGFEVNHYDFTLGRLAYERLPPVQDQGINSLGENIFGLTCPGAYGRSF